MENSFKGHESGMNFYIKAKTPLNKEIRTTKEYWEFIISVKHTNISGKENEVIKTLKYPEFIRKSNKDERVFLYYKRSGNMYLCVACRHLNGEGFIITISNR